MQVLTSSVLNSGTSVEKKSDRIEKVSSTAIVFPFASKLGGKLVSALLSNTNFSWHVSMI